MTDERFRHEYKYLITSGMTEILRRRIEGLLVPDPHAGPSGIYNISSAYFDDINDRCLRENEDGTDPREKFRIRIYNHDTSVIRLECKRKERGMTHKDSCLLSVSTAEQLLSGKPPRNLDEYPPLVRKLSLQMILFGMKPVVIVEYDRIPFVGAPGNVRVTFDTNLSSSPDIDSFLKGPAKKRPVLPIGMQLLEVKWDEFLPDTVYRACQDDMLIRTAFSKFYLCRRYGL